MYGFKKWCSRTESTVLQYFKNRTETAGSDRSVRPVGPLTGHKTGPVQCKKPFLIEPANRRSNGRTDEPAVEPTSSYIYIYIYFFKLKRCRFDAFYIETMSFYL